jgi:hypothetical protein
VFFGLRAALRHRRAIDLPAALPPIHEAAIDE